MIGEEIKKFLNTVFGQRICMSLRNILLRAKKENAIIVFMSRKGYWLYRLCRQCAGWTEELFDDCVVISDRYIAKWSEDTWNGRPFYLIDDTVTSGVSMFYVYKKLREQYPDSNVTPIALFVSADRYELIKNLKMRLQQENMTLVDEFMYDFQVEYQIPASSVGWLSYQQIYAFQNRMISYVVDLPVISEINYNSDQPETENNHQYSVIARDVFEELQRFSGEWEYVDNSYRWDDVEGEYAETKKISCGFFQYNNTDWYSRVEVYIEQLVIKCRYEELDDGNMAVVFTPFAIVNSIRHEDAMDICRSLYADTPLGKWLDNEGNQASYVLLLRSIVYFMSFYAWVLFKEKLKAYLDTSGMKVDMSLLQENSDSVFIDTVKMMGEWNKMDFQSRINQTNPTKEIGIWLAKEKDILDQNAFESAYELLYQLILEKKREERTDGFVTIEQMEELIYSYSKNLEKEQRQRLLISVLLKMLDQSVLGNRVVYKNGVILRGFRYGENSDIALPFYNSYVMYTVYLFYLRCQLAINKQEISRSYFNGIHNVFQMLRKLLKENSSLNILFDDEILDKNEKYFSDNRAELWMLVENKMFRVNKDKRIKIVDKIIEKAMEKI